MEKQPESSEEREGSPLFENIVIRALGEIGERLIATFIVPFRKKPKQCRKCGESITKATQFCHQCGSNQPVSFSWARAVVALAVVFGMFYTGSAFRAMSGRETANANSRTWVANEASTIPLVVRPHDDCEGETKEIAVLNQRLVEAESKIRQAPSTNEECTENAKRVARLTSDLNTTKSEYERLRKSTAELDSTVHDLRKRLDAANTQSSRDRELNQQLRNQVAESDKQIGTFGVKFAAAEAQFKAKQEEIDLLRAKAGSYDSKAANPANWRQLNGLFGAGQPIQRAQVVQTLGGPTSVSDEYASAPACVQKLKAFDNSTHVTCLDYEIKRGTRTGSVCLVPQTGEVCYIRPPG